MTLSEIEQSTESTAHTALIASESLHRCNRGTVTIGFLLMSMTLYISVAGIWNTGVLVDQKIQTQVAADAAAHAAATQMSSTINRVAMLNMLILRAKAASVIYDACEAAYWSGFILATIRGAVHAAIFFASLWALAPNWPALAISIRCGIDIESLIQFRRHYSQADRGEINDVFDRCKRAQNTLVSSLAETINKQAADLEDYLPHPGGAKRFNIYVVHPKTQWYPNQTSSASFLQRSSYSNRLTILGLRVALADMQWATVRNIRRPPKPGESYRFPALQSQRFFRNFRDSWVRPIVRWVGWTGGLVASTLARSGGSWGYDLCTRSNVVSEWPGTKDERSRFKVIAVAQRKNSSNTFMARGFFKKVNEDDTVVAVAQAETQNVYNDFMESIPGIRTIGRFPWRMWSSMGACWQGRLMQVEPDVLKASLKQSPDLPDIWKRNTQQTLDDVLGGDKKEHVFLH